MKTLQDYIDAIIAEEGGYTNDPSDAGGETNFGITKAVAEANGYTGNMKDLPRDTAVNIYTAKYWVAPHFDQVFAVSPSIAFKLLDAGVNMGQSTPGKFLQRALNVLNSNSTLFPDMTVDGVLGTMTVSALTKFIQARGADGESVLLKMINAQQAVRYMEITEANPVQEKFIFGWIKNRVGV